VDKQVISIKSSMKRKAENSPEPLKEIYSQELSQQPPGDAELPWH
jgi:hypothetical protein